MDPPKKTRRKRTRRVITLKLSREEAEGLMNAGNRGLADLEDAMGGEDDTEYEDAHEYGGDALNKLGRAMREAGWGDNEV